VNHIGNSWASFHAWPDGQEVPTAGWTGMTLLNHTVRGNMLEVSEDSLPKLTIGGDRKRGPPARTFPLARCFAYRDGDRYVVVVLSLKMSGKHHGQDFGDGATPASVVLPFSEAKNVTLYWLTGRADTTNMNGERQVNIRSQQLDALVIRNGTLMINEETGGTTGGLPSAAAFVYVFEGAKK
jgi:hypothetical protein